jgi:hypothetical protein
VDVGAVRSGIAVDDVHAVSDNTVRAAQIKGLPTLSMTPSTPRQLEFHGRTAASMSRMVIPGDRK